MGRFSLILFAAVCLISCKTSQVMSIEQRETEHGGNSNGVLEQSSEEVTDYNTIGERTVPATSYNDDISFYTATTVLEEEPVLQKNFSDSQKDSNEVETVSALINDSISDNTSISDNERKNSTLSSTVMQYSNNSIVEPSINTYTHTENTLVEQSEPQTPKIGSSNPNSVSINVSTNTTDINDQDNSNSLQIESNSFSYSSTNDFVTESILHNSTVNSNELGTGNSNVTETKYNLVFPKENGSVMQRLDVSTKDLPVSSDNLYNNSRQLDHGDNHSVILQSTPDLNLDYFHSTKKLEPESNENSLKERNNTANINELYKVNISDVQNSTSVPNISNIHSRNDSNFGTYGVTVSYDNMDSSSVYPTSFSQSLNTEEDTELPRADLHGTSTSISNKNLSNTSSVTRNSLFVDSNNNSVESHYVNVLGMTNSSTNTTMLSVSHDISDVTLTHQENSNTPITKEFTFPQNSFESIPHISETLYYNTTDPNREGSTNINSNAVMITASPSTLKEQNDSHIPSDSIQSTTQTLVEISSIANKFTEYRTQSDLQEVNPIDVTNSETTNMTEANYEERSSRHINDYNTEPPVIISHITAPTETVNYPEMHSTIFSHKNTIIDLDKEQHNYSVLPTEHSMASAPSSSIIPQVNMSTETSDLSTVIAHSTKVNTEDMLTSLPSTETVIVGTTGTFSSSSPLKLSNFTQEQIQTRPRTSTIIPSWKDIEDTFADDLTNGTGLFNLGDIIIKTKKIFVRPLEKLNETEKDRDLLTITFEQAIDVMEWFKVYDDDFRKCVSEALTENKVITEKWNRTFLSDDVAYVEPNNMVDGKYTSVRIIVTVGEGEFMPGKYVLKAIAESRIDCTDLLDMNITQIFVGFTPVLENNSTELPVRNETIQDFIRPNKINTSVVTIATISAGFAVGASFAICFICRKRKTVLSSPPTLPSVASWHKQDERHPADGHHLATDQECTDMEECRIAFRRAKDGIDGATTSTVKGPESNTLNTAEEHEKWVVPYDDTISDDGKYIEEEDDTKL